MARPAHTEEMRQEGASRDEMAADLDKQAQRMDVEGAGAGFVASSRPIMANGEPFELTPAQYAFHSASHVQNGLKHYLYQEFDGAGLEADVLNHAIGVLVERHPMLTAAFLDDGTQQFRPDIQRHELTLHDLRSASPEECETHLQTMRGRYGQHKPTPDRKENFDFQLTLLPDGRQRFHAGLNRMALDIVSIGLVLDELATLIRGEQLPQVSSGYDFRSYLAEVGRVNEAARYRSKQFWMERLNQFPEAPRLPLAHEPEQIKRERMLRRRVEIQAEDWTRFKANAERYGVAPSIALATCFGAVMARWCNQPRLLLSMMLFERQPLHPAVSGMIANFTNILLLNVVGEGEDFHALAEANQQAFAQAYEHRHWSGVELLQELRRTPGAHSHGTPVTFSSNLDHPLFGHETQRTLGMPGWGITWTPRTWIDHLVYEQSGSIVLLWDSNDALFPSGLVDAMFEAYGGLVRRLSARPDGWREQVPDLMPTGQRLVRKSINAPGNEPLPEGLLHDEFFRKACACPGAVALIHGDRRLSYGQLAEQARRCAGALAARGVQPGDTVAVSMPKGIGQIIAVLGILYVGAVYVPVSLDQPQERRDTIYHGARTTLVLTCSDVLDDAADRATGDQNFLCWQDAVGHTPLSEPRVRDAGEPAYIIYTSGSTGMPKGVSISHRGALNTCEELNRRYDVGPSDRVLALSGLHFDLSVYDIFGLLSAGGALVLVDEQQRRDPSAWCKDIERHRVTLWNTVPALFDMLLTYCEAFKLRMPEALRAVLLSGDWIGLDLPARYRAFRSDGKFVAMGGATEASIWSNVYDVEDVPSDWRSIPYGYPLARQKYRVVDPQGRDCPDWVAGELWIGGAGVALGYFNDPERTSRQFVTDQGERWYRTGDMGCYWPDGRLEFLGRRDKQVKIGGYRIELGEIEVALLRVEGVKSAVALAIGEREKSLVAFVVPERTMLDGHHSAELARPEDGAMSPGLDKGKLSAALRRLLPSYMIPQRLFFLETLPLTANGKVDHSALMQHCAPRPRDAGAERLVDGGAHE